MRRGVGRTALLRDVWSRCYSSGNRDVRQEGIWVMGKLEDSVRDMREQLKREALEELKKGRDDLDRIFKDDKRRR
jgi:hypothetical protein